MSVMCSARVSEGPGGCDSCVMHTGEGPIPVLARRRRKRFQRRVTVGVFSHGGVGEKLSGPGAILLLEGEHRRDKPRGSLAVRANSSCTASTVSTRQRIRLSITFLPLARLAVYEEPKRHSSQRVRRLATSAAVPRPGGTEASKSFKRPSSSSAKSSLPRAMPLQHCAVAAIMRRWQLEGMRSQVLVGG